MVTAQTNAIADEEEPMFMQYFRGKGGNARSADAATGASTPTALPQFRTVSRPSEFLSLSFSLNCINEEYSLGASQHAIVVCVGCGRAKNSGRGPGATKSVGSAV